MQRERGREGKRERERERERKGYVRTQQEVYDFQIMERGHRRDQTCQYFGHEPHNSKK
jgi:hypothetical protein